MPSLIPRSVWARRLVYELVYAWPGSGHATTFNAGLVPVDRDILADSDLAQDASQIQLYAELLTLAKVDDEAWRHAAVVEVAAGCGGGLLYLSKRHTPREAIGIDISAIAARRGGASASISARARRPACRSWTSIWTASSASRR